MMRLSLLLFALLCLATPAHADNQSYLWKSEACLPGSTVWFSGWCREIREREIVCGSYPYVYRQGVRNVSNRLWFEFCDPRWH